MTDEKSLTVDGETGEIWEKRNELFTALAIAQGSFKPVETDKKVDFATKSGQRVKYNYASFAAIVQMAQKSLSENGLSILQYTLNGNLITMLAHNSGQHIESIISLPDSTDIKQLGTNLSYLRRYQYTSIIGAVIRDEDDERAVEGNINIPQKKKPSNPQKQQSGTAPKKKGDSRNYLDELFDEVQRRTDNYYKHKAHLYNALGGWPPQDDTEAIAQAIKTAVTHASNKADEKAAAEEGS